jgi:rhodanese-related sulfurtransferase
MKREELRARLDSGRAPFILDVRSEAEYRDGHVAGAVHIPFQQVAARAAEIPVTNDAEIVVYCGHGPRAWIAAAALRRRGFSNVQYLDGHMSGWNRAGFPIQRSLPKE